MFNRIMSRIRSSKAILRQNQQLQDIILEREAAIAERERTTVTRENTIREIELKLAEASDQLSTLRAKSNGSAASAVSAPALQTSVDRKIASVEAISPSQALDEWRAFAPSMKSKEGAQAPLSEPYILEQRMNGIPSRFLIGTREGRDWYDKFSYNETSHLEYIGLLNPGDVVFDCGTNHGVNALSYSASVGPSGSVYCFDPFEANIKIAKINAALNGRSNINFFVRGLSDKKDEVVVSIDEQCVEIANQAASDKVTIKLDPIDDYAHLNPTFLKIDIEGAEIHALMGAQKVLKTRPSLYVEIHDTFLPRFGKKPMDMFNYVKFEDYDFFLNYEGLPALTPYDGSFDLIKGCAVFCKPKGKVSGPLRFY